MARYNSLTLEDGASPLIVSARDDDGNIMAIRHPSLQIVGVQFHPESCASEMGGELISSFIHQPQKISKEFDSVK